MRRSVTVGSQVPNVFAQGYEGVVDCQFTPARRSAILLDLDGHRVVQYPIDAATQTVTLMWSTTPFLGAGIDWTSSFTCAARAGHEVLVLGVMECRYCKDIMEDVFTRASALDCVAYLNSSGLEVYGTPEVLNGIVARIAHVAETQLHQALESKIEADIVRASWWLQRSAQTGNHRNLVVNSLLQTNQIRASDVHNLWGRRR